MYYTVNDAVVDYVYSVLNNVDQWCSCRMYFQYSILYSQPHGCMTITQSTTWLHDYYTVNHMVAWLLHSQPHGCMTITQSTTWLHDYYTVNHMVAWLLHSQPHGCMTITQQHNQCNFRSDTPVLCQAVFFSLPFCGCHVTVPHSGHIDKSAETAS